MEVYRKSSWLLLLILVELQFFFGTLQGVHGELDAQEGPSESECRPYIEKALKELETGDTVASQDDGDSKEDIPTVEITTDDSDQPTGYGENEDDNSKKDSNESAEIVKQEEPDIESNENDDKSKEDETEGDNDDSESGEQITSDEIGESKVTVDQVLASEYEPDVIHDPSDLQERQQQQTENLVENIVVINEAIVQPILTKREDNDIAHDKESNEATIDDTNSKEDDATDKEYVKDIEPDSIEVSKETKDFDAVENEKNVEDQSSESTEDAKTDDVKKQESHTKEQIIINSSKEDDDKEDDKTEELHTDKEEDSKQIHSSEQVYAKHEQMLDKPTTLNEQSDNSEEINSKDNEDSSPVEELIEESGEVLSELRPRDHIAQLLKLDEQSSSNSQLVDRMSDIILRDLKKLYDHAIKPLEILYKYKDLSNRHYGDSEIFAKPLILFVGPWSGGKSTIINYLLGIEYSEQALHTGAEPSPAYFNILMYGEEPEVLDGTQLAADYTFSGLQKFGQGLEERLRGYKLPSKLLEKVNIVEIPGILEVRKQVSRVFPFNDACQWFIDRADIIFLVYDPSKLDVGPETEAILDQLKGREHQTRIVLNKADQVKPEELMRVQGALIWNISPLMSSAQPPIMYTISLWSNPYEVWAPVRLLQAQERAFLRDIRSAVDKKIDNKIASARRFAVRVRNHAKMVDCYLTTYYNHKSVFGNRKQISDEIINHPQDFHIYEGLSTLTNISRYDLPDPDVYRDFFRLNALYDFQQLSATCTYFRGCPINRLDIAIAYDLPELVGKHKKLVETAVNEANKQPTPKS